eukprot:2349641-Pleurochrysis_carterae.AAC.2
MSAESNVQPAQLDIPLVDEPHADDATAEKTRSASRMKLWKSRIVTASSNFAVQYNYNDIAWTGKVCTLPSNSELQQAIQEQPHDFFEQDDQLAHSLRSGIAAAVRFARDRSCFLFSSRCQTSTSAVLPV